MDTVGTQSNKSFILVTGNSDRPASYSYSQVYQTEERLLNSPLLIAWFAENLDFSHPKVHPLPIGLENREYKGLGTPSVMAQVVGPVVPVFIPGEGRPDSEKRPILSYMNFMLREERPERGKAMAALSNISWVPGSRISHLEYALDLKKSKFTVSPPGVGWDCHRTWESVLFGSIPIVLHSPYLAELYSKSPVMVVKDWSEITQDILEGFRVNTTSRDLVFVDYWLDKIEDVKMEWRYKHVK